MRLRLLNSVHGDGNLHTPQLPIEDGPVRHPTDAENGGFQDMVCRRP